jgi:hypothetical protein
MRIPQGSSSLSSGLASVNFRVARPASFDFDARMKETRRRASTIVSYCAVAHPKKVF